MPRQELLDRRGLVGSARNEDADVVVAELRDGTGRPLSDFIAERTITPRTVASEPKRIVSSKPMTTNDGIAVIGLPPTRSGQSLDIQIASEKPAAQPVRPAKSVQRRTGEIGSPIGGLELVVVRGTVDREVLVPRRLELADRVRGGVDMGEVGQHARHGGGHQCAPPWLDAFRRGIGIISLISWIATMGKFL